MPTAVGMTQEAQWGDYGFEAFRAYCDQQQVDQNEVTRRIWSRVWLKAAKLAAVVAVGVNPERPVITPDIAQWATGFEHEGARALLARFASGEVGEQAKSEVAQQNAVRKVIRDWVEKPWSELASYKIADAEVHGKHIIPWSYVSRRLTSHKAFREAPNGGATKALRRTVAELVSCGEIARVPHAELAKITNSNGEFYMLAEESDVCGGAFKKSIGERRRHREAANRARSKHYRKGAPSGVRFGPQPNATPYGRGFACERVGRRPKPHT